jgi:polar amino acid transport system substrate-binding protein
MKPMVVSRCFFPFLTLFLTLPVSIVFNTALGAETDATAMPLMFDLRERIAKPDLSALPRLRFLTSVDFPPFNFLDQSGKLSGFHVDLAREICQELKIIDRCQIEALPYKELQAALAKGDGEVVAAGVRITPELRAQFAYSRVFMQLPARFIVTKPIASSISAPAQLAADEVGVVDQTAHQAMLATFFPGLKARPFASSEAMLAALAKGDIKAAFGDSLQLSFWLDSNRADACCRFLGGPYYSSTFFGEGLALMTNGDTPQITAAIDYALIALARNGRLNEIYLRYFPSGL